MQAPLNLLLQKAILEKQPLQRRNRFVSVGSAPLKIQGVVRGLDYRGCFEFAVGSEKCSQSHVVFSPSVSPIGAVFPFTRPSGLLLL